MSLYLVRVDCWRKQGAKHHKCVRRTLLIECPGDSAILSGAVKDAAIEAASSTANSAFEWVGFEMREAWPMKTPPLELRGDLFKPRAF